jgi:outer membrane protein
MIFLRFMMSAAVVILGLSFVSHSALAQEPTKILVKFAVINMEKIRREASAVTDINEQIKNFRIAFQADVKKEEDELRAANEELARQRAILSTEAFAEERRKFEQRLAAVQRSVQKRKQELDKAQTGALIKVRETLHKIVLELANEESLTLIFRKNQTVLVAKPLEITDEVMARLNKALPTVKVEKPGQP